MSDTTVSITSTAIETILIPNTNFITQTIETYIPIVTGAQGPQGIQGISSATALADITDVDISNISDGALLVYNINSNKWISSTTLDKQVLDSGQY